MQILDEGHKYQLLDGQEIRFIKKDKDPVSGEFRTVWVGTTNEELLEVLIDRTERLNQKMHSAENDVAIFRMKQALTVFQARTAARTLQNVEATPEQHQSAQAIVDEAKRIVRGAEMRSIVHIKMGDDGKEFTPEEMAEVVNAFQKATLEPDVVIGTRGIPLDDIISEVGGTEIQYADVLFRYLRGGPEELTVQEMINLEGYFSYAAYKRANPDGDQPKASGEDSGAEEVPVDESTSLIGVHDASHTTVGVNESDRQAVFQPFSQVAGTEVQPSTTTTSTEPNAAWAFDDDRSVINKVADDMSGKMNWQGHADIIRETPSMKVGEPNVGGTTDPQ